MLHGSCISNKHSCTVCTYFLYSTHSLRTIGVKYNTVYDNNDFNTFTKFSKFLFIIGFK